MNKLNKRGNFSYRRFSNYVRRYSLLLEMKLNPFLLPLKYGLLLVIHFLRKILKKEEK